MVIARLRPILRSLVVFYPEDTVLRAGSRDLEVIVWSKNRKRWDTQPVDEIDLRIWALDMVTLKRAALAQLGGWRRSGDDTRDDAARAAPMFHQQRRRNLLARP